MLTGIRHTVVLLLGCLLLTLALAACGGGPSEGEIEATVVARIEEKQAEDAALEAKVGDMVEATAQAAPTATQVPPDVSSLSADYLRKGNDYYDLGDYEQAVDYYDEAIRLDPLYAEAYSSRGLAYVSLGQHERAIQDVDEAIRLNPPPIARVSSKLRPLWRTPPGSGASCPHTLPGG